MKINRQEFLQELRLRDQIRKAIRVIRERRQVPESTVYRTQLKEEMRLRQIIRMLLKEEGEGDESTGISYLRRDLNKILEELEDGYTALRTSKEQRDSYRTHILNAIQDLLVRGDVNFNATPDVDPDEIVADIDEAVTAAIGDGKPDPRKRIDIGRTKPDEEPTDKAQASEKEELDSFALTGQDLTGAKGALRSMKQIENVIVNTYADLYDPNDRDIYADYLITNLQLYFDEFEDELQKVLPEPVNPDYEQRKSALQPAGAEPEVDIDTGIMDEESDPI
jgi:hypothetical protein